MIDLDVFLPDIMPFVPGCPELVAMHHARKAAIQFCERTRLWRDEDSFALDGQSAVVATPAGADLFEVEYASVDDRMLEPISYADLNRDHPTWRDMDGGARWISQVDHDSVLVVPNGTGTLRLCTFLKPSEDADQVPEFIAKHYRRLIADGALAEILMLPGQPFSDPNRATFYSMRFENGLSGLLAKTVKGQQRARTRTKAQWF